MKNSTEHGIVQDTMRTRPRVVLDCDTGIDDALALMYLAARVTAGDIDLAITTSAGNVEAPQCACNSAYVLEHLGVSVGTKSGEVPVAVGCRAPLVVPLTTTPETHGSTGLGYVNVAQKHFPTLMDASESAPDAWSELWPGDHVIVTGPCTNLCAFIDYVATQGTQPVSAPVTIMGGAIDGYPGNTTPTAEWNAWVDPHAMNAVFKQYEAFASPLTLVPLNVTEHMVYGPREAQELCEALGSLPFARDLPEILRFYYEFHEQQGIGYCAYIHDLLATLIAMNAVEYEVRDVTLHCATEGEARGTVSVVPSGPHRVVTAVDYDAAKKEVLRALRR